MVLYDEADTDEVNTPVPPTVRFEPTDAFPEVNRLDQRLFVVVGPCSLHDVDAALDYANNLQYIVGDTTGGLPMHHSN